MGPSEKKNFFLKMVKPIPKDARNETWLWKEFQGDYFNQILLILTLNKMTSVLLANSEVERNS